MNRRVIEVLSLTLVWAVLWGHFDLATLLSGAAVSALLLLLVPPSTFGRLGRPRPGRLLIFIGLSLWRLIESNAEVAYEALTRGSRIQEAILAVPVGDAGDEITTIIAASISLEPGTVAVGVRPGVVYVHVLHAADLEQTRQTLRQRVSEVKRIFGDPEPEA